MFFKRCVPDIFLTAYRTLKNFGVPRSVPDGFLLRTGCFLPIERNTNSFQIHINWGINLSVYNIILYTDHYGKILKSWEWYTCKKLHFYFVNGHFEQEN